MWVNNIDTMLRKHYIAPSALVVVLGLNEGLSDHQPTNDNVDNQFVKSHNQLDDEW